jgi:hypothetical protein
LKTNIKEEKENRENTRHEITSYVESMELDRKRLESELKSLTERMTEYRGLYEKYVKSLTKKGSDDKKTETIIFNNFIKEKTDKFIWKGLDLYKDFSGLKTLLQCNYNSPVRPSLSKEIGDWFLQKDEYIVGVYYSNNQSGTIQYPGFISKQSTGEVGMKGGVINEIIFYTNYGNVTSIKYYNDHNFLRGREVLKFRLDKILTKRMINVINKSISSGFREREYICSYKSSEELYEFICEVAEI